MKDKLELTSPSHVLSGLAFESSSEAEQCTVNAPVAGSIPASQANLRDETQRVLNVIAEEFGNDGNLVDDEGVIHLPFNATAKIDARELNREVSPRIKVVVMLQRAKEAFAKNIDEVIAKIEAA